ncbi:MAG: DUF4912 domain-containing protein [Bacillota bacterium]|nr:DUF4912 domain-containing protein [Bacillota bacterium]
MKPLLHHYGLPWSYEENIMTLMVRDPYCLFVYWELAADLRYVITRYLGCAWENVPLFLQLFEAEEQEGELLHVQDFSIDPNVRQWYLNDLLPDRDYCSSLAVQGREGCFYQILQSNRVHTPWVRDRVKARRPSLTGYNRTDGDWFLGYKGNTDSSGPATEKERS